MATRNSLNRKEIKGRILEHQEVRKNMVNKNMGKYNRLSFSSWVFSKRWGLTSLKDMGNYWKVLHRGVIWSDVAFKRVFLASVGTTEWEQGEWNLVIQSRWWRPRLTHLQKKWWEMAYVWICFESIVNRICYWWLYSKKGKTTSSRTMPSFLLTGNVRLLSTDGHGYW